MKESLIVSALRSTFFSDFVSNPGKMYENPQSNIAKGQRLECIQTVTEHRKFDTIDGEPMEFE